MFEISRLSFFCCKTAFNEQLLKFQPRVSENECSTGLNVSPNHQLRLLPFVPLPARFRNPAMGV